MAKLNMGICIWCANREQEVCVERCRQEGKYRYLVPEALADWEEPPELPPFRELVDLPARERLGLIYLDAAYRQMATR